MPRGPLGWITGHIMARMNPVRRAWVVSRLDLQPGDYVLEVGFGSGMSIAEVAGKVTAGLIIGVDHSEAMFHQATKRNKKALDSGRVQLHVGPATKLPFAYPYFDKVFSIDVAQYERDPVAGFKEMKRVLRPGGMAVVGLRSQGPQTAQKLEADFLEAGFEDVQTQSYEDAVAVAGWR